MEEEETIWSIQKNHVSFKISSVFRTVSDLISVRRVKIQSKHRVQKTDVFQISILVLSYIEK
jgi:hypothetical protein